MECLPLLPFRKIVHHLSIEEILNLKLVNKWFYSMVCAYAKIEDNLVIASPSSALHNRRQFYSYDLLDLKHLVTSRSRAETNFLLRHSIISKQLARLYLHCCEVNVATLSSFPNLKRLEILYSKVRTASENRVLRLPDLQVLNCESVRMDGGQVVWHTPRLQKLRIKYCFIELIKTLTIDYLEISDHCHWDAYFVSCKLKSLHFNGDATHFDELMEQKRKFNTKLKIYYRDLECDQAIPAELAEDTSLCNRNLLTHFARHYDRLADVCPTIESIKYGDLEHCFVNDEFSEQFSWGDFLRRLVNLRILVVSEPVRHLDQLIKVLDNCKTITYLEIRTPLDQNFYDTTLHDLNCHITNLIVLDTSRVLDFEFALRFRQLTFLTTNQQLSVDRVVRPFLEQRKRIYCLKFVHRTRWHVTIEHKRDEEYELEISGSHFSFPDIETLITKINFI